MNIFGLSISTKAAVAPMSTQNTGRALAPVRSNGGWFGILESFTGAWQKNVVVDSDRNLLAFSAVYACVTLIANDVGKLRMKLMQEVGDGIWKEVRKKDPLLELLRRPNHYQNRIQFLTQWIVSKLLFGNTYVLQEKEAGRVVGLYILDPRLVTPLVADSGDVYYQINADYLSLVKTPLAAVPASEVIHDRMPSLWHPLLGVSPIYACGSSATQGIRIQANSASFFENMSRPSGVLTAPGHIPDDTAERLKKAFEENFSASKIGRLAVLGDALKYEAMTIPAADAQLIEQLKWTVEDVARCFHVPLHMIGSANPTFANIGSLTQSYYSQTLQSLIESLEETLNAGLALVGTDLAVELDLEALLRMDTTARYESYSKGIGAGWMEPDYARSKENMAPTPGGDTPYMQQQNWALAQLAKRDINEQQGLAPSGGGGEPTLAPTAAPPGEEPSPTPPKEPPSEEEEDKGLGSGAFAAALIAKFTEAAYAEI